MMTISHCVKNTALVLCCGLALSACDLFANPEKLKADTSAALTARNFSSAAQSAEQWTQKAPEQYEAYFALAQAKAQAGDKNAALVALEKAIKKGLKDDVQIESNTNLDPIKSMVAYQDLMKTNFPGRAAKKAQAPDQDNATVSIAEEDGKQVLRAGDVVLQVPAMK